MSPKELLDLHDARKLVLPPPQLYEIYRMMQMKDFDTIVNFAKQRSQLGSVSHYPFHFDCTNARVYVYPGKADE